MFWIRTITIALAASTLVGCQYPAANPGEPDSSATSAPQGAVSGDLQVPRASKLLKCLCSDIISPSARQAYPIIANETAQRQDRCSYLALEDESNPQRRTYLEVKVARVLTQLSYTAAINNWKNRLVLNSKVAESKPNANDEQTIIEGEDGDYKVRAIALFKSQSGILITTEENAAKDHNFSGAVPPAYFANVAASFPSLCE